MSPALFGGSHEVICKSYIFLRLETKIFILLSIYSCLAGLREGERHSAFAFLNVLLQMLATSKLLV